jgi:hypothetical protein
MAELSKREQDMARESDLFGMEIFVVGDDGSRTRFELGHLGSHLARRVTLSPPVPDQRSRFGNLPVGIDLFPGQAWPFSMETSWSGRPDMPTLEWDGHAPRHIRFPFMARHVQLPSVAK